MKGAHAERNRESEGARREAGAGRHWEGLLVVTECSHSVNVICVELDDVRLRRRSIREVSEKLAVLMRACLNVAPRERGWVGVDANVEVRDKLALAPQLRAVCACAIGSRRKANGIAAPRRRLSWLCRL